MPRDDWRPKRTHRAINQERNASTQDMSAIGAAHQAVPEAEKPKLIAVMQAILDVAEVSPSVTQRIIARVNPEAPALRQAVIEQYKLPDGPDMDIAEHLRVILGEMDIKPGPLRNLGQGGIYHKAARNFDSMQIFGYCNASLGGADQYE
jgi:hypothetical protein